MKKLVICLVIGVLFGSSSRVTAQETLIPTPVVPRMELPGGSPSYEAPGDSLTELIPEPINADDLSSSLQPNPPSFRNGIEYELQDCEPALLESTGTWLRRGFWYSEVDVVLMDRIWRRDNFVLAFQNLENVSGIFGTNTTGNSITITGGRVGVEATPRLKIGRFLYRDQKNRDHAMEFIAYGGGQWSQSGRLDAVGGGVLQVGSYTNLSIASNLGTSRIPLDQGNISFDGATSMQYRYDSRFNNFELNYHLKSRMRKDRMELEPNGNWVRRAQPSSTRQILAGIRYFNLSEDFDWDAFGIDSDNNTATAPETGNYRVRTDNDLIGTQLGFGWTYETARWSLGMSNKSGIYLNHTDLESSFDVTGGVTSGNNDVTVDNLSFITEASLTGKWHLRPNFSLRAGLEIMYVSSLAHASEQLNFVPVYSNQNIAHGDSTFMGGSIGFERYW